MCTFANELWRMHVAHLTDKEDVNGSMTNKKCARDWNEFKKQSENNERQVARMKLVKQSRETLQEIS